MNVTVVAATHMGDQGAWPKIPLDREDRDTEDIDFLGEFSGRACYQSWGRPNPATRANDTYLNHILEEGHLSVLEHGSVTFYVTGISRSLTHELIRHRHLSYSQLSQRFVNEENAEVVVPPALVDDEEAIAWLDEHMEASKVVYRKLAERLISKGATRKEAREAARAVLPNMTETRIVVTGNIRAWREVIGKRNAPGADAEIRQFAQEILNHLKVLAPNSVQDLT